MKDFDVRAESYIDSLKIKHEISLKAFQSKLQQHAESRPLKWSRELIVWRKRQKILANQKNYTEALKIKKMADAMEDDERKTMKRSQTGKFGMKEFNFKQRQEAEITAVQKRINTQRIEHEKNRYLECKRLLLRNKNIQATLNKRKHV